jgi:hypothetical protein
MRYSVVIAILFAEYISSRVQPNGSRSSKVLTVAVLETKFPFRRTIPAARRAQQLSRSFTVEGYNAQKIPLTTQREVISPVIANDCERQFEQA